MVKYSSLMKLCIKYYSKKKFHHACRVAGYAVDTAKEINFPYISDIESVALAHDLLEDTECPSTELQEAIGSKLFASVLLLTKAVDEEYDNYVERIFSTDDIIAHIVKRADMKDHFMLEETLTDKLKEKYMKVIKYVL